MRRFSAALVAALLAAGLFAPVSLAAAAPSKARAVPHVVFIVGPAGAATSGYRAQARAAAAIARKYTPDVVELYSPEATWLAVREALQGASLVVYMGHGNGWPSTYRDSLYPPTQNGFGLNPSLGGGDFTHQYFGEASVGSQVKLAKNAIVLLNHLCYASGNSEPNLPEGNLTQAKQRVDNYAAGFIQAGAAAVIAEAWSSPSYFVKTILAGSRSIQSAWSNAPSANRNRLAFKSDRSAGYIAQMDTEHPTSGFTRSIVMKAGLASRDVLAGARGSANSNGSATAEALLQLEPTLVGTKLVLSTPDIKKLPAAGTDGRVEVPFKINDRKALPKGVAASVRWDPIDVATVASDPANEVGGAPVATTAPAAEASPAAAAPAGTEVAAPAEPSAAPSRGAASNDVKNSPAPKKAIAAAPEPAPERNASATNGNTQDVEASASPKATVEPQASGDPKTSASTVPAESAAPEASGDPALSDFEVGASGLIDAPPEVVPDVEPLVEAPADELDLVVPERIGDIVDPAPVTFGKKAMLVPVTMPKVPGKYRLTITLHDADGVAYDAATQALIPSLIVRVTGDFDGAIQAAPTAELTAGKHAKIDVRVVNLGVTAWGHEAIATASDLIAGAPAQGADVVGRWVPLSAGAAIPTDVADQTGRAELPVGLQPGIKVTATLAITAPTAPGQYLLLLDVVTPERGSLVAAGANPTLIRVTVLPAD
ncbi:MAG: hypothetical protein ABI562_00455 [Chloroflexota bacterium]